MVAAGVPLPRKRKRQKMSRRPDGSYDQEQALKLKYAATKSPAGGIVVRGTFYQGGKWIPGGHDMKGHYDKYAQVMAQRNAVKMSRRSDGSYDHGAACKYAKNIHDDQNIDSQPDPTPQEGDEPEVGAHPGLDQARGVEGAAREAEESRHRQLGGTSLSKELEKHMPREARRAHHRWDQRRAIAKEQAAGPVREEKKPAAPVAPKPPHDRVKNLGKFAHPRKVREAKKPAYETPRYSGLPNTNASHSEGGQPSYPKRRGSKDFTDRINNQNMREARRMVDDGTSLLPGQPAQEAKKKRPQRPSLSARGLRVSGQADEGLKDNADHFNDNVRALSDRQRAERRERRKKGRTEQNPAPAQEARKKYSSAEFWGQPPRQPQQAPQQQPAAPVANRPGRPMASLNLPNPNEQHPAGVPNAQHELFAPNTNWNEEETGHHSPMWGVSHGGGVANPSIQLLMSTANGPDGHIQQLARAILGGDFNSVNAWIDSLAEAGYPEEMIYAAQELGDSLAKRAHRRDTDYPFSGVPPLPSTQRGDALRSFMSGGQNYA